MSLLQELFPKRVFFLDVIIEELRSLTGGQIDMMIQMGIVQEMAFPTNIEIVGEYARLKKRKGKEKVVAWRFAVTRKKYWPVVISRIRKITANYMVSVT